MGNATIENNKLTIADLTPAAGLTDQYDNLLQRLCDTTTYGAINDSAIDNINTRFCHHLRHALQADTVYICNRHTLNIVATSSTTSASEECEDTESMHTALTAMVSDLWNCTDPLHIAEIGVFPNARKLPFIAMPLPAATADRSEQLLIAVDADIEKDMVSQYFATAIWNLFNTIKQHKNSELKSEQCENLVFNALQRKFRNSSEQVTQSCLSTFKQQLKDSTLSFGDSMPTNDHATSALQLEIDPNFYTEATVWGEAFQAELDRFCLVESSHGYKTLCENHNLLKFETSRPLLVKVHAQSFRNDDYIETLTSLIEKSVIHASRLQFEIVADKSMQSDQQHVALQEQASELLAKLGVPTLNSSIKTLANAKLVKASIASEFNLLETNGISLKTEAANQS